jgi:hypothetical protein
MRRLAFWVAKSGRTLVLQTILYDSLHRRQRLWFPLHGLLFLSGVQRLPQSGFTIDNGLAHCYSAAALEIHPIYGIVHRHFLQKAIFTKEET